MNIDILLKELSLTFKALHVPIILANQDIAARYKRSKIGAFWITINIAVFISVLSFVFGNLLNNRIEVFVPMLATALITWNFMSNILMESSRVFIDSKSMILETNVPILSHIVRVFWRNLIILMHNILILPFIYIIFQIEINFNVLQVIPAMLILILYLIGPAIILSIICLRFRDFANIFENILQIGFYLTPIIWMLDSINSITVKKIMYFNPFFYPITLMQNSFLSKSYDEFIYMNTSVISIFLLALGLYIFSYNRKRLTLWL